MKPTRHRAHCPSAAIIAVLTALAVAAALAQDRVEGGGTAGIKARQSSIK